MERSKRMRSTGFRGALAFVVTGGMILAACAKSTPSTSGGSSPSTSASASGITETKDATIAAEVPADMTSKGTLTVASDASYPPMEFFAPDNKTVIGADVDIGTAIGDVLGLKFNFVNATFAGIIPGL